MKRVILSLILAVVAIASFAQFGKKVVGNNKYTEVFHKVGVYNKLVVSNVKANVIYLDEADSAGIVKIYGEENIVSLIDVSSEKQVVTIKTKGMKSNEHGLLMIYVFCSKIQTIDLTGGVIFETNDPIKQSVMKLAVTGSGQIQIHNLTCDNLKISVLGNGDVFVGGKSKEANFSVVGDGEIRADKFEVETLSTKLIGNGNIGCTATKLLKATITGVGNIYYRGKPEIKSTIIGTGNVKPLP
ncbi:MAG: GIN domain-containing protein [Bacteroidales bacterium]